LQRGQFIGISEMASMAKVRRGIVRLLAQASLKRPKRSARWHHGTNARNFNIELR
jgi:hypothetical protein